MASYEYDSQNQELHRIAGGTLYADCPIGSYIPFGGTVIPTGWLLCNGQAVSRTDYADLFAVIGTAYGSGDGSTTFNIPDLRESVPKGAGLTGLSNNHLDADGLAVGEFIDDRVQEHTHRVFIGDKPVVSFVQGPDTVGRTIGNTDTASNTNYVEAKGIYSGRSGATTEVKSVGSNYIIKAKQIGVPADFASAIEDVIEEKFSYSTSEVNTGRKWIDGKPIYSKVVEINSATASTSTQSFPHGVTGLDKIITHYGNCVISNRERIFPYFDNDNRCYLVYYDNTNIVLFFGYSTTNLKLVIEYTKSS